MPDGVCFFLCIPRTYIPWLFLAAVLVVTAWPGSAPEQDTSPVDVAEGPVVDELVEPIFGEDHRLAKGQLGDYFGIDPLTKTKSEQPRAERRVAKFTMLFEKMPGQRGQLRGLADVGVYVESQLIGIEHF